ncbi:cira protein [Canicola haemoglobinophilus]|uniref:Cira protein n=2 Tax=Canicola haemoglobinophilus TaxID=733 RepID=A0AB38HDL4_9PAST|nr:cira protein [Canicola haemoglobinophilus]
MGLLFETMDKQHSFDVTYFARNVDNYLDFKTEDWVVYQAVNRVGKTKIKGVELAYNGKFTDNLSLLLTILSHALKQITINMVQIPFAVQNIAAI